jgi:hypothetical protein
MTLTPEIVVRGSRALMSWCGFLLRPLKVESHDNDLAPHLTAARSTTALGA